MKRNVVANGKNLLTNHQDGRGRWIFKEYIDAIFWSLYVLEEIFFDFIFE